MTEKFPLSLPAIQTRLNEYPIPKADLVLGIGRGGSIPAKMVAEKIGAKLLLASVNYRDDNNLPQREEPEFLENLVIPLKKGSKILLVDDVSVTGKTIEKVKKELYGYEVTTLVFKGKADHVLFPEIRTCVEWPWKAVMEQEQNEPQDRRTFLKSLAGLTAGIMLPIPGKPLSELTVAQEQTVKKAEKDRLGNLLPKRKFGKTGISVTMLGLGGAHIARMSEKEAQRTGKVKYIGFSGHSDYKAHLRMLERTDDLQVCLMPINAFDPNYKSFINNVFPKLLEKGLAPIAMKTLANGGFFGGTNHFMHGNKPRIVPNVLTVEEALYFSWSLPISVLVTGADDAKMLQEKIDLAKNFKALDESKRIRLVERVAGFEGRFVEYYKV